MMIQYISMRRHRSIMHRYIYFLYIFTSFFYAAALVWAEQSHVMFHKDSCIWLHLFYIMYIQATYIFVEKSKVTLSFRARKLVIKINTPLTWLKYSKGLEHFTMETDNHCVLSKSHIWLSHIWIGSACINVVAGYVVRTEYVIAWPTDQIDIGAASNKYVKYNGKSKIL